jgi:hypothetical protein
MHLRFWGDSYDIVKQSLLRWLSAFGEWCVHPMLTEAVAMPQARRFAAFLGARLVSAEVLAPRTNREGYFASCRDCGNLLLDPNTGLRLEPVGGRRAPEFLFGAELVELAKARPDHLTMVLDMSHAPGNTRGSLEGKLHFLARAGVYALAYESHACFIIASCQPGTLGQAHEHLLTGSRLPASRFVLQEVDALG